MAGFGRIIQEESDIEIKNKMIEYMSDRMEDTQTSEKASHAVLLCQMETGRVEWSDCHKIDRIRRPHDQRLVGTCNVAGGNSRDKPLISKFFSN